MDLTLYGTAKTRTMRPLWLLEELGVPFNHRAVGPHDPAVMALNGTGRIPVLMAGGTPISDSTAICTLLADHAGRFTAPAGTTARGQQDAATHFVLDQMDALLWTAAKHSFMLPAEHRLPQIKDGLRWEWARSMTRLEAMLGDAPFLMGAQMTVPDIIAGHCLTWGMAIRFEVEPPRLREYAQRLVGRPAYQSAAAR